MEKKQKEMEETMETVEGEVGDEEEIVEEPNVEEESQVNSLQEMEKETERWKDRCARLQADFTNYKRRAEKEKTEYISLGIKKLAMDVLPVIDNLERAVEAGDEENPYLTGVILIEKQVKELLEKYNIVVMDALEKPFDPNIHHAVFVEKVDGVEPGQITEVLQKGYMMGEEVLRPAMVKVSE